MSRMDTICALASGAGRAAIAVIRISGPATGEVLRALCGLPEARHASLRTMRDPRTGTLLDRGLVLWFPAPSSFTGEDMAELHVHGGRAVVAGVLDAVLSIDGVRLAEPGEFALRAFENGKLDLTEVEGLADLINAETDAQTRQALAQAGGSLRTLYEGWRHRLLRAQALTEAGLDFADEADVTAKVATNADAVVAELIGQIAPHLADRRGERLRDGLHVVIAGAPNAGKSSLLNALARRDVAIVSEEAGTTRDIIEVHLDLDGLPVILTDTAGLRRAGGKLEVEGIRRALARAEAADLILWLIDTTKPVSAPPDALTRGQAPILPVRNKIDLAPVSAAEGVSLSAKTGGGIDTLVAELKARAHESLAAGSESPVVTRARHRAELEAALVALERFRTAGAPELKAEELRIAARHLGRLTGRVDVDEVLGAIFSEFCIGK
ncbi:MAG TPA: tRNA uridine-5-carboxymethylaminomethyl(34) synthesis GTPase MnmE [Methyloceanibacter sp.]|nr:tRNA uridine-5-carboxymethylaminomethyl(34) synthesis GTPase MnmE [Methyloceanibacter sp.]